MPSNNTIAMAQTSDGKYFLPSDSLGASTTSETQFTKSSKLITLTLPGSSKISNVPVRIKLWGRANTNTTTNLTVQIYSGTQTTIASNTSIATTGAKAINSTTGSFFLDIVGIWDSTSNMLIGRFGGHCGGTAVASVIDSSVAVPNKAPTTEGLGLSATFTFSASDAANYVILDGFEMDRE